MTIVGLSCVLLGLIAGLLAVMYLLQRRALLAVDDVSQQVQRIAIGGRMTGRVDVPADGAEVSLLATAINHLLTRAASGSERDRGTPRLFAELGDRIHEAVLVHRDTILHANRQFASLMGVERDALVGRRLGDLVPPAYTELVNENIAHRLAGEPAAERYEIEMAGLTGQVTRLEITSAVIDYDGAPALLVTGVEIIPTQTVQTLRGMTPDEEEQSRKDARRARALESLSDAVVTTDEAGNIEFMNSAAATLTGTSADFAVGKSLAEVVELVDDEDPAARGTGSRRAVLLSHRSGIESAVEVTTTPIRTADLDISGTVLLLRDVTEQRGITRQMSYQATHDALTGLINRGEFERHVIEALDTSHRGDGHHVLCYLDLDRFKLVNDTSGHLAGDSMLREVAKLLRDAVRDSDYVGRLGGDEFGMLLVGCPLEKARQIADDVCRAVGDYRFIWKDKIFNIGVSVGLVEISAESGTMEELLSAADAACYVAKKDGAGRVAVYSARDEARARQTGEIQWLQRLQTALKENRFQLYQQTIVPAYADDGTGPRMEVLVRMTDDFGNEVLPAEFMRAAERHKLMRLLDRWVVQTTFTAVGRGIIALTDRHSIAINISGQTLGDPQFLEFVVECLDRTGALPTQICFEISEAAVIANLEQARRFVGVLHGMGCQFAIDDFGSGVASFSNLRNLPLDYLKIDGSLTQNLARDSVNQAMVAAMIKLARSLKFKVIAEQVEEDSAADAVRRMGVDFLQGYAIGRPKPLMVAA
ncbi:MAG TPA: EAL domain-containing protein [Steroidobacteraceae bacterium]|jgi:diguanylate cyclase (GGDEF)-like protein/PAS domain S-box-containing protein|nr:EAL domain-containing protein [Steroidobacteraceae bacterium]